MQENDLHTTIQSMFNPLTVNTNTEHAGIVISLLSDLTLLHSNARAWFQAPSEK